MNKPGERLGGGGEIAQISVKYYKNTQSNYVTLSFPLSLTVCHTCVHTCTHMRAYTHAVCLPFSLSVSLSLFYFPLLPGPSPEQMSAANDKKNVEHLPNSQWGRVFFRGLVFWILTSQHVCVCACLSVYGCAVCLTKCYDYVLLGDWLVHMRTCLWVCVCVCVTFVRCVCVCVQGGGPGVDIYVQCSEFNTG